MYIKLKKDIKEEMWYSQYAGQVLKAIRFNTSYGYFIGRNEDVEFYVKVEDVELEMNKKEYKEYKNSIHVQYLTSGIELEKHGDWIDLKVAEDVLIKAGEYKEIPLGVKIALPEGYEAIVVPRSSTFKKYRILLANSVGVIDNDYAGEWMFPVLAFDDILLVKGTRIAQFRLLKNQKEFLIMETDDVRKFGKKRGGLGSTGN